MLRYRKGKGKGSRGVENLIKLISFSCQKVLKIRHSRPTTVHINDMRINLVCVTNKKILLYKGLGRGSKGGPIQFEFFALIQNIIMLLNGFL